jgi:phage terminase large subunit GpA-like protein
MKKNYWPEHVDIWRLPEETTVSQCADQHRILGRGSSKPGPWETDFTPFMRDVMDSFSIGSIEELWFIKPTQSGGTEAILNMLLYAILQDPGPAMIVEPTEALADEISQDRINVMVETCDQLKEIKTLDPDDLTKKKKTFSSMSCYLAWSNSPSSLASRPIRYAFFDEVNKYKKFSGEEASPLALGKERTNTFVYTRKIVHVSTPTTDAGYITRGEESCEARFRYQVPCPHCGKKQILVFDQVKFGEFKDDLQKVEELAFYECESCHEKIYNDQKAEMVRRGKWFDLNSGLEFSECIETLRPKRIGFQVNRLYSPWHTFGMVAREFLESKDYPERLMNWKNSWMAEPWVERYEVKTGAQMLDNVVETAPLIVPKGSVGLTCGIDPSGGGFWFVVLAWKPDMSPHLVRYGFLAVWSEVTSLVWESSYQIEGQENRVQIWRAALDTGGTEREGHDLTMTEQAYDWLRRYGRGKCFGVKGMSHPSMRKIKISTIDKMPQGQPIPGGITLLNLDTEAFKDAVHYRLMIKEGFPGRFTFHKETGEDFLAHLLSEEKRVDFRTGRTAWVQVKKQGHWLDACVYAYAVADPELQGGVRILGPAGQVAKRRMISRGIENDILR